jgi:hypothetical protein
VFDWPKAAVRVLAVAVLLVAPALAAKAALGAALELWVGGARSGGVGTAFFWGFLAGAVAASLAWDAAERSGLAGLINDFLKGKQKK